MLRAAKCIRKASIFGGCTLHRQIPPLLLSLLVVLTAASMRAGDSTSLEARRQQLKKLLTDQWEYELHESPEQATFIGDYRYNDRWSDTSLAHVPVYRKDMENWLAQFQAVDTTGFPEQEKLNQSLMVRNLKERLAA